MATPNTKWGQLTPSQVERLDKDKTLVVFPLGATSSLDPSTRLDADLRVLEGKAKEAVQFVNTATNGPLSEFTAISLPALWIGVDPEQGPPGAGTIVLPKETFEAVVESICASLWQHGIKYILLVTRDDPGNLTSALAERLNQNNPLTRTTLYNPMNKPAHASWAGDLCRAACKAIGCNSDSCPA